KPAASRQNLFSWKRLSSPGAILDGLEHRQHVFNRRVALDIVNGVADEAAVLVENVNPLAHFPINRRRGLIHRVLGINATAPEGDVASIGPLELSGLHPSGRT